MTKILEKAQVWLLTLFATGACGLRPGDDVDGDPIMVGEGQHVAGAWRGPTAARLFGRSPCCQTRACWDFAPDVGASEAAL